MVAAEAAAAGVLPVSAGHSGAAEVSRALAAALPPEVGELVSFPLDDGGRATAIAERLNAWLRAGPSPLASGRGGRWRRRRRELWSWEGVARGVLAASAGRLEELAPVPKD